MRISTAQAYDEIVDDFARRNQHINADLAELRAMFTSAVVDAGRVLDVGCGPGREAVHFSSLGLRVVGVDASLGMARRAHGDGVAVMLADMRAVPVGEGSIDGIWSAASLLHIPRPDVPYAVRSWSLLLRPQGVLGLSTSFGGNEGWGSWPYDPGTEHDRPSLRRWFVHHEKRELLAILESEGFEVLDSRERVSSRRWLQILARRADRTA
jgi:SAM-dependent methyltransferase